MSGYEKFCVLRSNAVLSGRSPLTTRRNVMPTVVSFLHGSVFDPENGGSTFMRNINRFLPDYAVLHLRRSYFSLAI
jgi:hypothetical protein